MKTAIIIGVGLVVVAAIWYSSHSQTATTVPGSYTGAALDYASRVENIWQTSTSQVRPPGSPPAAKSDPVAIAPSLTPTTISRKGRGAF